MISFVSKLFSGLFVISLEIRLHKKQIHLGPMNLRYQTPSPNIFLWFAFFMFFCSAKVLCVRRAGWQPPQASANFPVWHLLVCQCASVPFCTSLESGSYGVTNPDSLLCHRSPRLQCCADKLQNHPCLSCHCCKISFSDNTPQSWKYNS